MAIIGMQASFQSCARLPEDRGGRLQRRIGEWRQRDGWLVALRVSGHGDGSPGGGRTGRSGLRGPSAWEQETPPHRTEAGVRAQDAPLVNVSQRLSGLGLPLLMKCQVGRRAMAGNGACQAGLHAFPVEYCVVAARYWRAAGRCV